MVRKITAALAVGFAALLVFSTAALAETTEPTTPAITVSSTSTVETTVTTTTTASGTVDVSGTSSAFTSVSKSPTNQVVASSSKSIAVLPASGSLPNTGVSFNVPLTLGIAAVVVLAGFALVFFGGRGAMRGRRTH